MLRQSALHLAIRLFSAFNSFIVTLILLNLYGVKDAATYTVVAAKINILSAFFRMGQQSFIVKRFRANKSGLIYTLIFLAYLLFASTIAFISMLIGPLSGILTTMVIVGAILHATSAVLVAILRSLEKANQAVLGETFIISSMQTLLLLALWASGRQANAIESIYVLACLTTCAFNIYFSKFEIFKLIKGNFIAVSKIPARTLSKIASAQLTQSSSYFLSAIGTNLLFQYAPIRISEVYGDTSVAAYRISSNLYNISEVLINNIRQIIVRKLRKVKSTNPMQLSILKEAARISTAAVLFSFVLLIFFGEQFIETFFSINPTPVKHQAIILIFSSLVSAATGYHGLVLKMAGYHWLSTKYTLVIAFTFVLTTLITPPAHAEAFVLLLSATITIQNLILFRAAWIKTGIRTSIV